MILHQYHKQLSKFIDNYNAHKYKKHSKRLEAFAQVTKCLTCNAEIENEFKQSI